MNWASRILIACGIVDLLLAAACFILHALAFASQYSGFVVWISQLQGVEAGQPEYENTRLRVLGMLDRTSGPLIVALVALAGTGAVCLAVGIRLAKRTAGAGTA